MIETFIQKNEFDAYSVFVCFDYKAVSEILQNSHQQAILLLGKVGKLYIASYYRQVSADIKIKIIR